MNAAGPVGFAMLSFLPGAWLAFGLPLPGVERRVRTALAVVLSPVVVLAQFYVVRFLGASFSSAAIILLVGNVPAVALVYRRWTTAPGVKNFARVVPYLLVWVIPLSLLLSLWRDTAISALSAHAFLHSDVVYSLANGFLKVEDAQLAGLTLGYPWGGHVHQALASWVLGQAPVVSFQWTNAVLLIAAVTLITEVTTKLGGGVRARVLTVIWVVFAVNAVGYALKHFLVPEDILARFPVWGDERFTPWLRKYVFWNQHPFAHGLFAGILYFMVGPRSEALSKSALVLLTSMFAGLGAIYPLLAPAAMPLLAARLAAEAFRGPAGTRRLAAVKLGAVALIAAAVTVGTLTVIGEHRTTSGVSISMPWNVRIKTIEGVIALSPLLAAAALLFATRWKALPDQAGVPLLGGAVSVLLFVLFSIPPGRNEYKFIFTAAMCLAPLASIGFDTFFSRRGPLRAGFSALVVLFFIGTATVGFGRNRYSGPTPLAVRVDDFRLRLSADHHHEPALTAIAERTPCNTIVVVDSPDVHVPVFARRALYAPPLTTRTFVGVSLTTADLVMARGYGYEVVTQRQEVIRRLFRSVEPKERLDALHMIERLGRPIAVLLDQSRHQDLTLALTDAASGQVIHRDRRWVVWLWRAEAGVRAGC